jgi:hypothetical protein
VLSLVLPSRSAQTVGLLAAILACVVLGQVRPESRKRIWLLAGAVSGLVTAYGVSDLQSVFPNLSTTAVWVSALATGALVAVVTRWPDRWLPVAAVAIAVAMIGYRVNPIVFGLGDLRASAAARTAQQLGEEARADHTLVATDSQLTAALLVANGVPSITGYQVTGPVRSAWERLDPTDRYEHRWNRGASYLRMTFDGPAGRPPKITNPGNDIVNVSADPCSLRDSFRVSRIVSVTVLNQPCLVEVTTFQWSGTSNHVYEVTAGR